MSSVYCSSNFISIVFFILFDGQFNGVFPFFFQQCIIQHLCHILNITKSEVVFESNEENCEISVFCTVKCEGKTGVEMEALTGASVALLTVYDMCKAVQKDMVITDVMLLEKSGGVHGDFHREEAK